MTMISAGGGTQILASNLDSNLDDRDAVFNIFDDEFLSS